MNKSGRWCEAARMAHKVIHDSIEKDPDFWTHPVNVALTGTKVRKFKKIVAIAARYLSVNVERHAGMLKECREIATQLDKLPTPRSLTLQINRFMAVVFSDTGHR